MRVLRSLLLAMLLLLPANLWSGALIVGWNEILPPEMEKKPMLRKALVNTVLGEAFDRGMIGIDALAAAHSSGMAAMEALASEGLRNGADLGVYLRMEWKPSEEGILTLEPVFYSVFSIRKKTVLAEGLLNLPPMVFPSVSELEEDQKAVEAFLEILQRYL